VRGDGLGWEFTSLFVNTPGAAAAAREIAGPVAPVATNLPVMSAYSNGPARLPPA